MRSAKVQTCTHTIQSHDKDNLLQQHFYVKKKKKKNTTKQKSFFSHTRILLDITNKAAVDCIAIVYSPVPGYSIV